MRQLNNQHLEDIPNLVKEGRNMKELIRSTEFFYIGRETTVCLITLNNGFEIVGTSACVDVKDLDKAIGREWSEKMAMDKIEELDGLLRQEKSKVVQNATPGDLCCLEHLKEET